MRTEVRGRQLRLDDTVRERVERRLQFSLGRFSPRIERATVHLVDVNGPKGGEDKLCRVEIRLHPTGTVFVEDSDADLFVAVDRIADRAAKAVSRALERTRDLERATNAARYSANDNVPDDGTAA